MPKEVSRMRQPLFRPPENKKRMRPKPVRC